MSRRTIKINTSNNEGVDPRLQIGIISRRNEVAQKVTLKTEDGFTLAGDFYPAADFNGSSIVLMHQFRRSKKDWIRFAPALQTKGYNVLAIDMRGHGESSGNYNDFSDEIYKKMILDAKAAIDFLKTKKEETKIILIGASISANTAINAGALYKTEAVIALSPGLDYHGVMPQEGIKKYKKPLLIVVTKDDSYSYESAQTLFNESVSKNKKLEVYEKGGHAIFMFDTNPVEKLIIDWLKSI